MTAANSPSRWSAPQANGRPSSLKDAGRRDHRSDDLANTGNRGKPKSSRHTGPEPKLGRILSNPAPDAEDRLRRLFTLLAGHLAGEGATETEQAAPGGVPADDGPVSL